MERANFMLSLPSQTVPWCDGAGQDPSPGLVCWAEGGGKEITDMRLLPQPSPPLLPGVQAPGAGGGLLTAWHVPRLGPRAALLLGRKTSWYVCVPFIAFSLCAE